MLSHEDARAWIESHWAEDAFCCIQFRYPGIKSLFIKGAFTQDDALNLTDHVLEVDGAIINDVLLSVPDENTSWFTRLDTKDFDGNRLKLCHRCTFRFTGARCPRH
jgi:hypothetical protein